MIYFYENGNRLFSTDKFQTIKSTDIPKIVAKLKGKSRLCLDVESTGLDPILNKVIMLQIGDETDQYVFDTRGLDVGHYFKDLLQDESIKYVGHNIKFDYNMLKQYNIFLRNVECTYLNEVVLYNDKYDAVEKKKTKRFSLKTLTSRYLKIDMEKETQTEFMTWGNKPFTESQILYGARDVIFPLQIADKQRRYIAKMDVDPTARLESKATLAIGDVEYNGFRVERSKWMDAYLEHKKKLLIAEEELDRVLVDNFPKYEVQGYQLDLFSNEISRRKTHINWNSGAQVKTILNLFGINPLDKNNKPSTGTPSLLALYDKPPIVEALLEYREHSKAVTSFGAKFLEKFQYADERLRSSYTQIVGTGRVSSSKPNLQQIPSSAEYRESFTAPKGSKLITADYKNQEGVIMADLSGDPVYTSIFSKGGDVHSMIATTLFSAAAGEHVEIIDDSDHPNYHLRKKGKILNFMISFGGSAFALSKVLKMSEEEAQVLIDAFFKGFGRLKPFFDSSIAESMYNGFIRVNSVSKRIRWLQGWGEYYRLNEIPYENRSSSNNRRISSLKGSMARKAMNTRIQGTAGDITKTALIIIRKKLLDLGIEPSLNAPIKIVQMVHDEIVLEALDNCAEQAAEILESSMVEAGAVFLNIPLKAKPCIGEYWAHD